MPRRADYQYFSYFLSLQFVCSTPHWTVEVARVNYGEKIGASDLGLVWYFPIGKWVDVVVCVVDWFQALRVEISPNNCCSSTPHPARRKSGPQHSGVGGRSGGKKKKKENVEADFFFFYSFFGGWNLGGERKLGLGQ